jgi:hypothetical protein
VTPTTKRKETSVESLFTAKRARWLPLCRRLLARIAGIPGLEARAGTSSIDLRIAGSHRPIARIRVGRAGLEIGLALQRGTVASPRLRPPTATSPRYLTHRVIIAGPGEIDAELLTWIGAARAKARTSRRRST